MKRLSGLAFLALGCLALLAVGLPWRPETLASHEASAVEPGGTGVAYPSPAAVPGGDGQFQAYEYH